MPGNKLRLLCFPVCNLVTIQAPTEALLLKQLPIVDGSIKFCQIILRGLEYELWTRKEAASVV
jgi:hypothetical protein